MRGRWIGCCPTSTWQSASGDNAQVAISNSATAPTDGHGKYEMFAFVSHCGPSSMSGHYVCHIKKNGKWIIFNDEKVAESVEPPKDLGYLYFYKRFKLNSSVAF